MARIKLSSNVQDLLAAANALAKDYQTLEKEVRIETTADDRREQVPGEDGVSD